MYIDHNIQGSRFFIATFVQLCSASSQSAAAYAITVTVIVIVIKTAKGPSQMYMCIQQGMISIYHQQHFFPSVAAA